jgi:hypothetical protein
LTFNDFEEKQKLQSEAFSSRVEREIVKALYDFRDRNPLRPKDILQFLPSELFFSSGSRLSYHLDKLCRAGLVERKYVGKKLTWYKLTSEGRKFYEKLPKKRTVEDVVRFLANIIAPYAQGVSEDEISKTVESLLNKGEVSSNESGRIEKETGRVEN